MHLEEPLQVEIQDKDANYSVTVNGKFCAMVRGKMVRNFRGDKLES